MISKLLFAISLAVTPVVSVSAQVENTDFDTFQTADKYLEDFDYLIENTYRLSSGAFHLIDYANARYPFYVFPNFYDIDSSQLEMYYYNDNYTFYYVPEQINEKKISSFVIDNYVGSESAFDFLAFDFVAMNQVIEHDKEVKSTNISIYSSFYNFFTGFFPQNVVAEYHGIFTFVIVAFLLFLVFGFVFFLFRVIRRLVGFK